MRKLQLLTKTLMLTIMLIFGLSSANAQDEVPVKSYMTNAAIFVKDMDASLTFYTEYMG